MSAIHPISLLLAEIDQLIVLGDLYLPNISWLESEDSWAMIPGMNMTLLIHTYIHSISLLLAEIDQLIVLGDLNLPNIYLLQSGDSLAMNSGMQHDFIDGDDTISKLTGFPTILVVFLT